MDMIDRQQLQDSFKGNFITEPAAIREKFFRAKAYVFDWDGVFNDGAKDERGSSPFNEVDSMGINMLRFNHFLRKGNNPVTAIISGEKNIAAVTLAKREHFHAAYFNIKNKKEALLHLCAAHEIKPVEVAYFFDDVLDLSIAELCRLRIMVGRACNPLLLDLAQRNGLADYLTAADGGNNALREAAELLMGLSGQYDDTILQRVHYSDQYRDYIDQRNVPVTSFYTLTESEITKQPQQ